LTVKVDHLKVTLQLFNLFSFSTLIFETVAVFFMAFLFIQEKPYDKDDDVIKATSFEVISTLRDVLKTSSLWKDHVQTYTQVLFFLFLP
jgi:hypothetical protein